MKPIIFKHKWDSLFTKVAFHVLFWIIVVTYFAWGFGFNGNYKGSFTNALLWLPGHIFIVYVLLYWLIPKFLIKRKYVPFFIGLILAIACCKIYVSILEIFLLVNDKYQGFTITTGRAILPFIHVAGIAISIKLLSYWYQQKQQTLEAQQQRTQAELQLLKSQLHPHFLFNTLNNLYSHTIEKSAKAPDIVLKLSELLRFMVYESGSEKIPLEKELTLLRHYTELEQLRYGNRLDISLVIKGDTKGHEIAPLLLLPFLENAFKHGTSKQLDLCWMSIDIMINEGAFYLN